MKIVNKTQKFQEGGPMPAGPAPTGGPAPAGPEQGGDPIMEMAQVAAEALQTQNCEAAMAVCQAFIQLIQESQGGAPPPGAPVEQPVFKKGGKMKKCETGGNVKKGKDLNIKFEVSKKKDKKY